jgi:uncharacterized protein (DUF111 family)
MEETGTLGVRYQFSSRFKLERAMKTIQVKVAGRTFDVRVKFAKDKSGKIVRLKPEFDDIRSVAQAVSLPARAVSDIVLREAERIMENWNGET